MNVDLYSYLISKHLQSFVEQLHDFIASFALFLLLPFNGSFFGVLENAFFDLNEVLPFNELGLLDYFFVVAEVSLNYLKPECSKCLFLVAE